MTTVFPAPRRALARGFVAAVAACVWAAGCASDDAPAPSDANPSTAPDASSGDAESPAPPAAGEVGSEDCTLERQQLSFVVRDWGRVYGSIGRGDHHDYTSALARELADLDQAAAGCRGDESFDAFLQGVKRIDDQARRPAPDFPLYDATIQDGNDWLKKVGFGTNALPVG